MPYTINHFDTTKLADVQDGRYNDDYTHIKFVGRNFAGYGEIQNENFLWLLENFASSSQPTKKVAGMVWFDSGNKKLKFWDGNYFRTTGGAEVGDTSHLVLHLLLYSNAVIFGIILKRSKYLSMTAATMY